MKDALQIIKELFDKKGISIKNISGFYKSWSDFCGNELSQHSEVDDIKDHIMFINVDHPGWKQTILMRKSELLEKINAVYCEMEIQELRIRIVSALQKNQFPTEKTRDREKGIKKPITSVKPKYDDFKKYLESLKK